MAFTFRTILAAAILAAPGLRGQDALDRLNAAFRGTYAQAKADALARGGPVLLLAGDQLALYRHNVKVAEETVRPALYHRLKAVDHVPLALHLLLGSPVPRERTRELRGLVLAARDDLGSWAAPPDRARQERILDACLGLLDEQLGQGALAPARLAGFAAAMGPLLLANADSAAALELEALDGKVARFRKGMAAEDWRALRVVIIGSHMAREGEVAAQYFSRLFGEGEGDRIVFAEGLWQPKDALVTQNPFPGPIEMSVQRLGRAS